VIFSSSHVARIDLALCQNDGGQVSRAVCRELPKTADAPDWIELIPAGNTVEGLDGRKFSNAEPERIIEAFAKHPHDIPLDWEHSTELKAPEGNEAPAAGWIKELQIREGAIWARIEWTERGRQSVINREYRYVSPAFLHTKQGEIIQLVSAGLTNRPNLRLPSLNQHTPEEPEMDPKLLALLQLDEKATPEQVLEAVKSLHAQGEKLAKDLELAVQARETPPLDKWVPRADYDAATNRAAELQTTIDKAKTETLEAEIKAEIDAAKKAGKVAPATEAYHLAACRQEGGLERFREFVKTAPKIIDNPEIPKDPKAPEKKDLDDLSAAICTKMGHDPDELAMFKADPKKWEAQFAKKD
jgi:phage I-like protein